MCRTRVCVLKIVWELKPASPSPTEQSTAAHIKLRRTKREKTNENLLKAFKAVRVGPSTFACMCVREWKVCHLIYRWQYKWSCCNFYRDRTRKPKRRQVELIVFCRLWCEQVSGFVGISLVRLSSFHPALRCLSSLSSWTVSYAVFSQLNAPKREGIGKLCCHFYELYEHKLNILRSCTN